MVMLEACPLFRELTPAELKALQASAVEKQFSPNQEIFKEGDDGDGMYVVKDGSVQISGLVGKDVRHIFSQAKPGDVFGEMAILENKPRSASAVAVEPTVVYFISRVAMLQLVETSPHLSLNLLREISNRLREFNRQYIKEVLQTERLALVGRFARSIVHDLKNPLNIISLTAEMTGMAKCTPENRQAGSARILKQVDRISELVNEILEFTQGSSGSFILAATPYDMFVRQVTDEIRPEIELRSVIIEFENQPPPVKMLLNPKRLRRVFYNLMFNATDAMGSGGKIIFRFLMAGNELVTEIEDTGAGISPEIADRLFDAFATYGKAHGTGLGLSISKKIIEDQNGKIWARNEPGRGAIFSFSLPIYQS